MDKRQHMLNREPGEAGPRKPLRPHKSGAASSSVHTAPSCRSVPCRKADDDPIEATPAEHELIRAQLKTIERMLAGLFGAAYDGGPVSLAARAEAADIVDQRFDEVVEKWSSAVERTFDQHYTLHRPGMANALVRFVDHLRDPKDLTTYIYLR